MAELGERPAALHHAERPRESAHAKAMGRFAWPFQDAVAVGDWADAVRPLGRKLSHASCTLQFPDFYLVSCLPAQLPFRFRDWVPLARVLMGEPAPDWLDGSVSGNIGVRVGATKSGAECSSPGRGGSWSSGWTLSLRAMKGPE